MAWTKVPGWMSYLLEKNGKEEGGSCNRERD